MKINRFRVQSSLSIFAPKLSSYLWRYFWAKILKDDYAHRGSNGERNKTLWKKAEKECNDEDWRGWKEAEEIEIETKAREH